MLKPNKSLRESRANHYESNMLTIWNRITTEFYGRRIYGSYVIEGGTLKVKTPRGEIGNGTWFEPGQARRAAIARVSGAGKSLVP
jgi:hypothetical protein